jgi:hypothetical protein
MKSMRVSQEDWDAIWDRSEGVQERLFDDEGNVPPAFRATGLAYPVYCLICKKWSTIEDGKPGDEAQCANPTCRIKSVIKEARGGPWGLFGTTPL